MDASSEVFAEVERVRTTLPAREQLRDERALKDLSRQLSSSPVLRRLPAVSAFLDDLDTFVPGGRLEATKAHINERRDNQIFSLFRRFVLSSSQPRHADLSDLADRSSPG